MQSTHMESSLSLFLFPRGMLRPAGALEVLPDEKEPPTSTRDRFGDVAALQEVHVA